MNNQRNALLVVTVIFCGSFFPVSAEKLTVVDYYRLCPAKYFGGVKHSLEFKDGYWQTDIGMGMAEVDIKNGYIECSARGDGENINQFVLYVTSNKTPIVAISSYYHAGISPMNESSSVGFYEYRNKEFRDITRDIIPEIDFRLFLAKGYNPAGLDAIKGLTIRDYIDYRYTLPQKGTTVIVAILTYKLNEYLDKKKKTIQPEEKELCDKFLENIQWNKGLELTWDVKQDKFVIGKLVELPY